MKPLFTLILSLLVLNLFAQKRQNVYFLKHDGKFVDLRDSADYIRVVSEPDSGSVLYNVSEFYKDGSKKLMGRSTEVEILKPEGTVISFWKSGKKKLISTYKNGVLTGLQYEYFSNGNIYTVKEYHIDIEKKKINPGDDDDDYEFVSCNDSLGNSLATNKNGYIIQYNSKFEYVAEQGVCKNGKRDSVWTGTDKGLKIKFTETYKDGALISGISIDSAGQQHPYTKRIVNPQYKGGVQAFAKYLSGNIKYPSYAFNHEIQGKVFVCFTIKTDGTIKDIKVLKSPHESLTQEAVRVISASKNWQAGVMHGLPVNVMYTVPVGFNLAYQ